MHRPPSYNICNCSVSSQLPFFLIITQLPLPYNSKNIANFPFLTPLLLHSIPSLEGNPFFHMPSNRRGIFSCCSGLHAFSFAAPAALAACTSSPTPAPARPALPPPVPDSRKMSRSPPAFRHSGPAAGSWSHPTGTHCETGQKIHPGAPGGLPHPLPWPPHMPP